LAVVDITSSSSLVSAFKGQDAVVNAIGHTGVELQDSIADAAVEAGVKLYIPSLFGMYVDHTSPCLERLEALPLKTLHVALNHGRYLDKLRDDGKLNVTIVRAAGFFEWGKCQISSSDTSLHDSSVEEWYARF
jgi:hypothetical protein